MTDICVKGEAAQLRLGAALARACPPGRRLLIFLDGDLGAGKTTLVRGFLQGLGHEGSVKSPTYTLVEPYDIAGRRVYHLDLYRVADPGELEYLGLREMLAEPAILLIEWPQQGAGWLPNADLHVRLEHAGDARHVAICAHSADGEAIASRVAEHLQ